MDKSGFLKSNLNLCFIKINNPIIVIPNNIVSPFVAKIEKNVVDNKRPRINLIKVKKNISSPFFFMKNGNIKDPIKY